MIRTAGLIALMLTLNVTPAAAVQSTFEDQVANTKSPNAKSRQKAASELGRSRRRDAVTHLAAMVRDPDASVRLAVVRALRELRDLVAIPALVTSMQDGDPRIRREALEGVLEAYVEPEQVWPGYPDVFADDFDERPAVTFAPVVPAVFGGLRLSLRDDEQELRELSAHAVGILGGRAISDELLLSLQDPIPRVRAIACTSLARVGTSEQGKALIPLLSDESQRVRRRALHTLGVLRVTDAMPALRAMYENYGRRREAEQILQTLSRLHDPRLGDFLRKQVEDPDAARRRLAIDGLARISDRGMVEAFKKDFQRARKEEIRLSLAFALALLGEPAFVDTIVLNLGSSSLRVRARNYLAELGAEKLEYLYPYLEDPQPEVRAELASVIGRLGDPSAIERLLPLVQDDNGAVADRANRAVERLRGVAALTGAEQ